MNVMVRVFLQGRPDLNLSYTYTHMTTSAGISQAFEQNMKELLTDRLPERIEELKKQAEEAKKELNYELSFILLDQIEELESLLEK